MKKEKMVKIGLIAMTMMILLLGASCSKSSEDENDMNVIISLATQSISDINEFSGNVANLGNRKVQSFEKQAATPCQVINTLVVINQAIGSVVNPSPKHGWLSGGMGVFVDADCSVELNITADIDCTLGASMASGDTLGGLLSVNGTIDAVSGSVSMSITERSSNFSVNNRSHNVHLIIHAQGTLAGGTLTITGFIDDQTLDIAKTY